jgi:DeoR family transcriptional regulator, fructose operon transcriptional repressor
MDFIVRETKNIDEKREIAEIAVGYVLEGQSISLDVSTTNT